MTFTIWSVTFLKNELFMIYQRFKKGGRIAKSLVLAKSVQKSLNKKNKIDFFQKTTFFESPITQKRFIFEESHISYTSKRQKSCTLLFRSYSYLTSLKVKRDRPDILSAGEEVVTSSPADKIGMDFDDELKTRKRQIRDLNNF